MHNGNGIYIPLLYINILWLQAYIADKNAGVSFFAIDNSGVVGGFNTGASGLMCDLTNTSAAAFYVKGVLVVNAAGTFTMMFAKNVSGSSASSLDEATIRVTRIS